MPDGDQTKTVPKRANLPLPRELRDQIYGYLLNHDSVRGPRFSDVRGSQDSGDDRPRSESLACTYCFHIQVLNINQQVRDEALEILSCNRFIIVSYVWPELAKIHHQFSVPIVTEHPTHVARFKHHVMRIHIQAPPTVPNHLKQKEAKVQSVVMLAADLPAFCQMMQWLFYQATPRCKFITRLQNTKDEAGYHAHSTGMTLSAKHFVTTKIQLQSTAEVDGKPDVKALLGPFQNMIAPCQKVVFLNLDRYESTVDLHALKHQMGPQLVWTKAMAWHMLETAQAMQRTADALVTEAQDYLGACQQYKNIWTAANCPLFSLDRETYQSDLALPIALVARSLLDAATNWGFIQLRLGQHLKVDAAFMDLLDHLLSFIRRMPDPARAIVISSYTQSVVHLGACRLVAMASFYINRGDAALSSTYPRLEWLQRVDPNCPYLQHDLELVKNVMRDPKVSLTQI